MSDYLIRGFRAQLSTTMDSVLRKAVFEIMKIFENTLYDHQMELAQKGEEVAQLKLKLQTVELKLKDRETGGDRGAEIVETRKNPDQIEPHVVTETSRQTAHVPEIDFEVPDDWCAPLGSEPMITKDEDTCPSVRLRAFSIPLWHVPIHKDDVIYCGIGSYQNTKRYRRSKKICVSTDKQKHRPGKTLPSPTQEIKRGPTRKDMKRLLLEIKKENHNPQPFKGHSQRKTKSAKGNVAKRKEKHAKSEETKSADQKMVKSSNKNAYSCKICKKTFDTDFGQRVHVRSHRSCRGCKKVFTSIGDLKIHKPTCRKLIRKLAKQASNLHKSSEEKKISTPIHSLMVTKKKKHCDREINPSETNQDLSWTKPLEVDDNPATSSMGTSQNPKKAKAILDWQTVGVQSGRGFRCLVCHKFLGSRHTLVEHNRIHTGEKPYKCMWCPAKYRYLTQIYKHKHKCCFRPTTLQ